MNKAEMEKIIDVFWKWFEKTHNKDYTLKEAKLIDCYGYEREGAHNLISFWAGYKISAKEKEKAITKARKDGLTCGIAYSAGILNRYHSTQAAEFILAQAGIKSIAELKAAGCDQFDIDNIGDLLPEIETFNEYKEAIIKQGDKLEAAGGNWNEFFCGKGGCPYATKKCDPDNCGYYFHYKNIETKMKKVKNYFRYFIHSLVISRQMFFLSIFHLIYGIFQHKLIGSILVDIYVAIDTAWENYREG
ncbi:MAG: hypothetical protein LBT95_02100 [Treponema sp.]|jgi:hypothetical protein|nr:hypothetical protein [Treponema sp.]